MLLFSNEYYPADFLIAPSQDLRKKGIDHAKSGVEAKSGAEENATLDEDTVMEEEDNAESDEPSNTGLQTKKTRRAASK